MLSRFPWLSVVGMVCLFLLACYLLSVLIFSLPKVEPRLYTAAEKVPQSPPVPKPEPEKFSPLAQEVLPRLANANAWEFEKAASGKVLAREKRDPPKLLLEVEFSSRWGSSVSVFLQTDDKLEQINDAIVERERGEVLNAAERLVRDYLARGEEAERQKREGAVYQRLKGKKE